LEHESSASYENVFSFIHEQMKALRGLGAFIKKYARPAGGEKPFLLLGARFLF